jgi:hypothetical protein
VVIVFHDEASHKLLKTACASTIPLNVLRQIHQASLLARSPEDVVKIAWRGWPVVPYSRASVLLFSEPPQKH